MNDFRLAILAARSATGEYAALENNLSQAIAWMGNFWQLTKPAEANFIFMLISSAKTLKTLQILQGGFPAERIIVATSVAVELPHIKWLLPFPKTQRCPTVLSIVNLLSRIWEHYPDNKPNYVGDVFEPTLYLPGIIEQSKEDGVARICPLDSGVNVVLAPKESAYYFAGDVEQLMAFAGREKTSIKVIDATEQELAECAGLIKFGSRLNDYANFGDADILPQMGVKQSAKGNLSDLIWLSVLVASRGRTLSSYDTDDKVILLDMPDILLMDYFSVEYKKLSEIFISKPATVIEASSAAQRSLFDTINFCNACTVLNMTEIRRQ